MFSLASQFFMQLLQLLLLEGSIGYFSLEYDAESLLVAHLIDFLVLGEEEKGLSGNQRVFSDHIPTIIITAELFVYMLNGLSNEGDKNE